MIELAMTPAQAAEWLGVEDPEDAVVLLDHTLFMAAMMEVRAMDVGAQPWVTPEQVWAKHDLPAIDPDGLDVQRLLVEVDEIYGVEG